MTDKTSLEQMSVAEVSKMYDEQLAQFKEEVEKIESEQELNELEAKAIKDIEDWDAVLKDKTYSLPAKITWNNKDITRAQIGTRIRQLLDKFEVEFSYTLGYYQIASWWTKPQPTISYHMLDSTLRVLGNGIKFKGIAEWENILIINEYFKGSNDDYTKDLIQTYNYASKHNAIIDRLTIIAPKKSEE